MRTPSEHGGKRSETMPHATPHHAMSLEEENELVQFLKIVRPEWSMPKKHGHCDARRACEKLKAIGITDVKDLLHKIENNTINDLLSEAQKPRLTRETLQLIRKQGAFWHSLSHLSQPSYRQIGLFAPVPQLLAGRNLRNEHLKKIGGAKNSGNLQPVTGRSLLRPQSCESRSNTYASASQSARSRPSTAAFTNPYSDVETRISGSFSGTLPRLRGAKPKRPTRAETELWGEPMSKSASVPRDMVFPDTASDLSLPTSAHGMESWRNDSATLGSEIARSVVESRNAGCHLQLPLSQPARSSIHDSNASHSDGDDFDIQKGEKWCKAGERMSDSLKPGWSSFQFNTLSDHGEAMMREQEDLQHKKKLYQQMSLEGNKSPLRRHVAGKIHDRMREEKLHDPQVAMEVHQTCISIRKNLAGLSNARKNLNAVKMEAQPIVQPEQHQRRLGLSLEFFRRSKTKVVERDPSGIGTEDETDSEDD